MIPIAMLHNSAFGKQLNELIDFSTQQWWKVVIGVS